VKVLEAFVEGLYRVGAGEDQPVEGVEVGEGVVEGGEGSGVGQLDGGDEDGVGAEGAELVGECGGLAGGAGDEDAGGVHGGSLPYFLTLGRGKSKQQIPAGNGRKKSECKGGFVGGLVF
jgi:hypothetical protein